MTSKFLSVAALIVLFTPSWGQATDKSELEAKGLRLATGEEIAAFKVGKVCTATGFDESGKPQSVSTNTYNSDGTAIKVQGNDSRDRKWWMDGSSFCETLYSNDAAWCGAHEVFHILDNRMYGFRDDGSLQFDEVCE
jgi:hypothetical protein